MVRGNAGGMGWRVVMGSVRRVVAVVVVGVGDSRMVVVDILVGGLGGWCRDGIGWVRR